MLDGLGRWISEVIAGYGYPGITALMLLENLFPPIPSEIVLPLTGFFVGREDLSFFPALVAATAGSVAGAMVLYSLGRWGGRPLVLRYGAILRVKEKDLDRAESWFDRYDEFVVLFARLVPFARSVVSIPAGTLRMPIWKFLLLTAIGSAAWNSLLIGAGWYLGETWERVGAVVGPISEAVVVLAAGATVFLAIRWWRSRRR